jgi:hypothetical protein
MKAGICYYTDNQLDEPLYSIVQGFILESGLPITSASLRPITFGDNEVIDAKRSYPTMLKQIISCLERSEADYVYMAEHDILYNKSCFSFIPPRDNIFYYNENNLRWIFGAEKAISYDRMIPLSCMCANRLFALDHFKRRMDFIIEKGFDLESGCNAGWVRKMGFEPGTKKRKRGGFSDDDFEVWRSEHPAIDIRHKGTFSPPKCTIESFTHKPLTWSEIAIEEIPNWDLKKLFNL